MALADDAYRLIRTKFSDATALGKEWHALLLGDARTEAQAPRIDRPWRTMRQLQLELQVLHASLDDFRAQSPRFTMRDFSTDELAREGYTIYTVTE